ncbi:hypothetical protein [Chryseobacterium aquaeductus]|nr:hypothetical protein [Chryseobacterium aquaeductus]
MKNCDCKTENGYEIIGFGGKPIEVTHKIEKEGYKCISESVLWNPNPKKMTNEQLESLRNEIPEWASKNIQNFSDADKVLLISQLKNVSNKDFSEQLKYKFSYFGKPASQEIPIYEFQLNETSVFCPNYSDEYEMYGKKDKFGFEFYPESEKPNYPNILTKDDVANESGYK